MIFHFGFLYDLLPTAFWILQKVVNIDVIHQLLPDSFKRLRNYTDFNTEGLLFDLEKDPEQKVNLYSNYPKKVNEMDALLKTYQQQGYSVVR